jgi:hypothetical protein
VDAMTNKDDAINRRPEPPDSEQPDFGWLAQALGALRLLNDEDNSLSLRETIERARELSEAYVRWEQSGALIKDIVVRLSDGQEITMDQSNVSSLCGLHFRDSFPCDAVLHVWKKADEQFGEVQLLSLSLQDVTSSGHSYNKTYENGQTLSLRVERCSGGQLYISVDCTAKERAMVATPKSYSWAPLIIPAMLALSKLGSFLRQPYRPHQQRRAFRTSIAFGAGFAIATAVYLLVLQTFLMQTTSGAPERTEIVAPVQVKWEIDDRMTKPGKTLAFEPVGLKDGQDSRAEFEAFISSTNSPNYSRPNIVTGGRRVIDPDKEDLSLRMSDQAAQAAKKKLVRNESKPDEEVADTQKRTIYLKTDSKDEAVSNAALRATFISALESTKQFIIVENNSGMLPGAFVVDIRFAPKKDCHGVLLAEIYDGQGHLVWNGNENCNEFSEGKLLEGATQELVAQMLLNIKILKSNGANTE